MDDDTSRWSRRLDFDWHFLKLSVFHFFRREEEGIICITAEEMKGKFGHSAFMIYHALLICEGDADIDTFRQFCRLNRCTFTRSLLNKERRGM